MPTISTKSGLYKTMPYFGLAVLLTLVFYAALYFSTNRIEYDNIVERIEKTIKNDQVLLETIIEKMITELETDVINHWPGLERAVKDESVYVLIYEKDSLVYWNNNQIRTELIWKTKSNFNIISDKSNWYTACYKAHKDYKLIIYKHLSSSISNAGVVIEERASDNIQLHFTNDRTKGEHNIYSKGDLFLVGVSISGIGVLSGRTIMVLFSIYLLIYILVILWILSLYNELKKYFKREFAIVLFIIFDLLILRLIEFYLNIPGVLKNSYIFEIQYDIVPLFNSSGDILLSSITILFASIQVYKSFNSKTIISNSKTTDYWVLLSSTILFVISILLFSLIYYVLIELPYDSFYGFKIGSLQTILAYLSILISIVSLFLVIHSQFKYLYKNQQMFLLQLLIIPLLATLLILIFNVKVFIGISTAVFLGIVFAVYYLLSEKKKYSFYKYLLLIIIYAAITSFVVNTSRTTLKDNHQEATLKELLKYSDPGLEKTYSRFESQISNDSLFVSFLRDSLFNQEFNPKTYVADKYFNDLDKEYDIQVTVCDSEEMLEIKPENIIVNCYEYFEGFIKDPAYEKVSENLYLQSNNPGSTYYIGRKSLDINGVVVNIWLEFFFTNIPEGLGYPELLVKNESNLVDLTGYSIARYQNQQLINKFGIFPYLTSLSRMEKFTEGELFKIDNFIHLKHKIADNDYLIISRSDEKISIQLATFSGLFVIFLLLVFVVVLLLFGKQTIHLFRSSFQSRLQLIFLLTISIIIILLAVITLFYANIDNENRLISHLSEKTNSVIIELQHKLGEEENFEGIDKEELKFLLRKFSLVFFSDINLYDPNGNLISTSRPEIFDRGLLSTMINPMAYEEIFIKNQLFYITREQIGETDYLSAYAPIMLSGDQTAGIINLPYFAKQSEVNRSYYLMIFTFINLFVILGIIGTIIAILLSRIITKPLAVLQENLSAFQIDKRNEIIEWNTNDEIGQLITAYNEMIEKLEESTILLKRSERETAWREVAQQIAHEIKNPLTPMKLNIQYLEKAYREKDPELDIKIKNISEILINQIDTLNKVAEMFSDFAKTKGGKLIQVDLAKVIQNSIKLYKNHVNVKIEFFAETNSSYFTKAFEKDISRLFTNLIKNAIYSTENKKDGKISISIEALSNSIKVIVSDNGNGIPDDAKEHIFQPYFTTKSKGTGLGLAIVKNIMNETGGEISFKSTAGEGTSFELLFPVYSE